MGDGVARTDEPANGPEPGLEQRTARLHQQVDPWVDLVRRADPGLWLERHGRDGHDEDMEGDTMAASMSIADAKAKLALAVSLTNARVAEARKPSR
jgi:hypothetical protein